MEARELPLQFLSDPQTGEAPGSTRGRNVRSKNQCSMCPAIHTKSRSWLRSSSTREPSDPLLRVVILFSASLAASLISVRVGFKTLPWSGKRCRMGRCALRRISSSLARRSRPTTAPRRGVEGRSDGPPSCRTVRPGNIAARHTHRVDTMRSIKSNKSVPSGSCRFRARV